MPDPIQISKAQARRFLVAHHRLTPPRTLKGKQGILDYFDHVGSIQFDSINVVGGNPDLVLQSRVANYKPKLLQELLYADRKLIDGWDKQASIFQTHEWPHFGRRRLRTQAYYGADLQPEGKLNVAPEVKAAISKRGPLSSIDLKSEEKLDWHWGVPTTVTRATMEALYAVGELGIHHRVHTRRVFDLIENLLPAELLDADDPHPNERDYLDWHLTRRVGSMGLAHRKAGEYWFGIRGGSNGVSAKERNQALDSMLERGLLLQVAVEGDEGQPFLIRADDLPILQAAAKASRVKKRAAFIAALDNFMWQRHVIKKLFDFPYTWEVYMPAEKRQYGYYVLPVLYGNQLVARVDPKFERDNGRLIIQNWWWQAGVDSKDEAMLAAIGECLAAFAKYLDANEIVLGEILKKESGLRQALKVA